MNLIGSPCKEFRMESGIMQGCPLASYLLLVVEELFLKYIIGKVMKKWIMLGVKLSRNKQ